MAHPNALSRAATLVWKWRNPGVALSEPGREGPRFELAWRAAPRYALDRAQVRRSRRRQVTEQPWITEDAIRLLDSLLRPTDVGLEVGAGGSTVWLARRTAHLTSIETHEHWHRVVSERVAAAGLQDKVSLHLLAADEPGAGTRFVPALPELAPESLDFVFVDGGYRDDEAMRAVTLLTPGGLLILDNANTYLPGDGRSPWRVSRPATDVWAEFAEQVATWRRLWTTNGVWDTAIWVKTSPG